MMPLDDDHPPDQASSDSESKVADLENELHEAESEILDLEERLDEAIPEQLLHEIRAAILKGDLEWAVELIGREVGY
jgi:hypothetical protein